VPFGRACAAAALLQGLLALPLPGQVIPGLGASTAAAREEPAGGSSAEPGERAAAELVAVQAEIEAATARWRAASPESSALLAEEVQTLQRIELCLRRQVAAAQLYRAELVAERGLAEELRLFEAAGPAEPPPYRFLHHESLRDRWRDEGQRAQRLQEAAAAARDALSRARAEHGERESELRLAREAAGAPSAGSEAQRLALRAELERRAAREELLLAELELDRNQAALAAQERRLELARAEAEHVGPLAALTEADRLAIQGDLAEREQRARADSDAARRALELATERWLAARRRLEAGGGDAALAAEAEAHQAEQDRRRIELGALEQRLDSVARMREVWERRLSIFQGLGDGPTLHDWCAQAEADLAEVEREEQLALSLMGDARQALVTLDARIEATASTEVLRWLRQARAAQTARVEVHQGQLTALEEMRRLLEKLIADAGPRGAELDLAGWLAALQERLARFWSGEFFHVQDQPITPGMLVWALAILLFGTVLSKRLSALLGRFVLPRFGLNEGARNAFESLGFYVLVVAFALLALRMVNIPLTAFTILGGALAIGFGFGSQNIVKNFISGLIILAEQPVRVGDLIQVDQLYGTVQHIGLRSTRLRTGENVEIIVPNSNFLEQSVINWTLTDTRTRIHVAVGFAYGSNTRDIKEILRRAVAEHGRVLETPEPVVLFKDFGDSALEFEVHFWIHMQKLMDKRALESDIRFRIESLCREAGLLIAFPQRDVHLTATAPLPVRVLTPEAEVFQHGRAAG
jgi:small-conductance mechanosensitive channel